jgi:hypothetical protein
VPRWTTNTPDGRRLVVSRRQDGWTVACAGGEFAPRKRLDVALMEALLLGGDVALHAMPFDYAAWSCEVADQIEHGKWSPDNDQMGA